MTLISIVIGLYNSAKTIEAVIDEIKDAFLSHPEYDYEMVLVDDHSPDNVYEIVKNLAQKEPRIKVIHLAKNAGQTNALITGFQFASGEYIVEMDDDLQMPAKGIFDMINAMNDGNYDVVFARYPAHKESAFRLFGSKVNQKMTEIMLGKPKDIEVNSFYVMRKFIRDGIVQYSNNFPSIYGIIFSQTKNVANVDVEHRPRTNGKSNYTFSKLLKLWFDCFLGYSVKPLRIATVAGGIITAIGFIFAIIIIIQRLIDSSSYTGWTSLMVAIVFFSGVELLSVGLLGEYLGRMFISVSNLPRTVIKETVNIETKEND